MTRTAWDIYARLFVFKGGRLPHPVLVLLRVLVIILTCLSFAGALATTTEPFLEALDQERMMRHCMDSNGTLHGLFSSWNEKPGCRCTCHPTAGMAVSICDGCVVVTHATPLSNPTGNGPVGSDSELGEMGSFKRKSCFYSLTNVTYHHGEIWMSAQMPCVKCRCDDGRIRCTGEPHHCPPLCLPGQHTMPPGPCCEITCRGKALQNLTATSASCPQLHTGVVHPHGDFITLVGTCVDQKCLCVNGRWTCLDFCVPLARLPCAEAVVWDPFCCPRCPGTLGCTTYLTRDGHRKAESDDTPNRQKRNVSGSIHSPSSAEQDTIPVVQLSDNMPDPVVVPPGTEVALAQGRCFCLNASIMCPRPGRHIWHDEDCYYVDNYEGTYYAPHAHWTPQNDPCTECECLENRTYICRPRSCTDWFLCPEDKQPVTRPGECCPSFCGKVENSSAFQKPTTEIRDWGRQSPRARPSSIGLFQDAAYGRIKSPQSENQLAANSAIANRPPPSGCPLFGALEDDATEPTVLPPGTSLMQTRPCRSLLCLCTAGSRWTCTDHCPACARSTSMFERLESMGHPPPAGQCCQPCGDPIEKPKGTWYHLAGSKGLEDAPRESKTPWEDSAQIDRYPPLGGRPRNGHVYDALGSYGNHVKQFHEIGGEARHQATKDQIEQSLKMYVTFAGLILFAVLGIPMATFVIWYLVNRQRRRPRRTAQRSQFLRRKHPYLGKTLIRRPAFIAPACARTSSEVSSPNTSPSQWPVCGYTLSGIDNQEYDQTATGDEDDQGGDQSQNSPDQPCVNTNKHMNLPDVDTTATETIAVEWESEVQPVPPVEQKQGTKPVTQACAKPNRVKSMLLSRAEPHPRLGEPNTKVNTRPASLGQPNPSARSVRTEMTPMLPPSRRPERVKLAKMVRRTASTASANSGSKKPMSQNGMPKRTVLTRASTWLTSTNSQSNHVFRRFLSNTASKLGLSTQRHSDYVAGLKMVQQNQGLAYDRSVPPSGPNKERSNLATERQTYVRRHSNDSATVVHSLAKRHEIDAGQRTRSESRIRTSRQSTAVLIEPIVSTTHRTKRDTAVHYFLPVIPPQTRPLKQESTADPKSGRTISRSPETENTSITDSQTFALCKDQLMSAGEDDAPDLTEASSTVADLRESRVLLSDSEWSRTFREKETDTQRTATAHPKPYSSPPSPQNDRQAIPVDQ